MTAAIVSLVSAAFLCFSLASANATSGGECTGPKENSECRCSNTCKCSDMTGCKSKGSWFLFEAESREAIDIFE